MRRPPTTARPGGSTWTACWRPRLPPAQTPRYDSIQHAALGTALNSSGAPEGFFAGVLKQARVWNYARSQPEIAAGMNEVYAAGTGGLLGQWALDETSGTMASDSSGQNINGTLIERPGLGRWRVDNRADHQRALAAKCDAELGGGDVGNAGASRIVASNMAPAAHEMVRRGRRSDDDP